MDDLISRKAAIDAYGDWYAEEGTAEGFIGTVKQLLEGLPSAESEIIRCKDCKYWHREIHNDIEYFNFSSCDLNHYGDGHNFYCADAERRTDE